MIDSVVTTQFADPPRASQLANILVITLVVCIPFLQLGHNYYLSIMILAFMLAAAMVRGKDIYVSVPTLAPVLLLMLLPVAVYIDSGYAFHSVLRTVREFLCLSLFYIFIAERHSIAAGLRLNAEIIRVALTLLILFLFAAVIVQYVSLKRGLGLFIPSDYYILNAGTIPTELDLLWSNIRPSATFGEPSYLGFISTSLLLIVLRFFPGGRSKLILSLCVLLTTILANTLAGIIACFGVLFTYSWSNNRQVGSRVLMATLSLALVAVILTSGILNISERLTNLTNPEVEASGYQRITVPIKVVATILTESPIGIPTDVLPSVFKSFHYEAKDFAGGPLSNGFFNIIINYGAAGIVIIFFVVRAARGDAPLITYLFFSSMFNGSIFTFDKAAVISLTALLVTYRQRQRSPSRGSHIQRAQTIPIEAEHLLQHTVLKPKKRHL